MLTPDRFERLGKKILATQRLLPDEFGGAAGFSQMVLSPTSLMFELGAEAGILYAENVHPGSYAYGHVVVFKRRALPDLEDLIRETVAHVFSTFRPAVMAAWIPEFNHPARCLAERLDWHFDGTIRRGVTYGGVRHDVFVYSITREEALGIETGSA